MVENYTALYAIVFYVTIVAVAGCELLPLNRQTVHLVRRWPTNLGLFALNFVVMWLCVPISAVEVAQRAGSGPLAFLPAGAGIGILLGVLALDLWKYCEHRVMHKFSPLWRFHLVHHSDTDVDFTTTERHHPIEVAFSSVGLFAVIYVLAVPPLAVVIFVLFGTVVTFASHANIRLPGRIEQTLCWLIVTPSVHVIHHSALRDETDSNYGLILTVWDRLFGSYCERSTDGEAVQGLEVFRAPGDARLDRVLWHPFAYRTTARATPDPAAATARDHARDEAAQEVCAGWSNALLGIGLGLVVLVFAFQSTAMELVSIWSASTTYGYAWLVLPALAYLLWYHRQRFFADRPTWSLMGIAASAACGVAWLVFDLLNIGVGRQFALVAAIPCLVLSAVGVRAFARLAPSLTLLALLVPSGDLLLPSLKTLTVNIIAAAAVLAHIPYSYDGQVIFVGANRYVIIDDCAGLPYLLTTLFLGLTFGLLMYRSAWKIGLFALLGVGCGIVANGVRVVSIVLLDWIHGTRMELSSHVLFQWLAFALAIAIMVAVMAWLPSEPEEPVHRDQTERGARAGGRSLFAALCATVLAVSIPRSALAHIDSSNEPAAAAETGAGDLLPERFAGWTKLATATSWNPVPRTPIPYALARYSRGDQEIEVFVAATERPTHKVTGYAIDLVGPGQWVEAKHGPISNCLFPRCDEVQALELDRQFSNDVRHVYYVYALGGRVIGSALQLQLQRAWDGFVGAPKQARIIAVASDGEAELRPADIAEAIDALASGEARE